MQKLRRAITRHGLRGVLRITLLRASRRLGVVEHHIWYSLELAADRPRRELDPRMTLRPGSHSDLPLLEGLPAVSGDAARERLDRANRLWLVVEGEEPRFVCWVFRGQTPAVAAPGGEMPLDEDTACLEDSLTLPAARGRGVAPAAWAAIADDLASQGVRQLITKVEVDNISSRRAVEKAGFQPVAIMHYTRLGSRARTRVDVVQLARGTAIAAALGAA